MDTSTTRTARVVAASVAALGAGGCGALPEPDVDFGGRLREQFEHYTNRDFGFEPPEHDTYLLHRLLLNGRAAFGDALVFEAEIINALAPGKESELTPIDENAFDLHRGSVDVRPFDELRLRFGRQELLLGRGRLVSVREGPNVRRNFDGIRATFGEPLESVEVDTILFLPPETGLDAFDDEVDTDEVLWGTQLALTPIAESRVGRGRLETYYLGRSRDRARFDSVVGREMRHSFGFRWAGPVFAEATGLHVDFEAVGQLGTVAGHDIAAWTVSSSWTRPIPGAPWKLQPGVRLDAISGDRDPTDGRLETFDALYPNNSYFNEAAIFAPANLYDINPNIAIEPREDVSIEVLWDFLWRQSLRDGVYVPPGVPAIAGDASGRRFIGHSISLDATWRVREDLDVTVTFTHFEAGPVVRDAGGTDVDSVAAWVNWRF